MDWNPFDINNNDSLDPFEVAVGASFIGSIGYGAGLSEAEERESYLRDEYEDELDRKKKRIKELEDELDNLRSSRYDDDEYDYDNKDEFDDDDDYSYLSAFETTPNAQDLASARKLSAHLRDESGSDSIETGDCTKCAYWVPGGGHDTRGWCCQIWYWVQLECGGSIRDINPLKDKKICPKYQYGTGVPVTCYDCMQWNQDELVIERRKGCKNWNAIIKDINKLRREMECKYGSNIDFGVFDSEWPYEDKYVCFNFNLNHNLEPGYGKRRAEQAKVMANLGNLATKGTYVAGVPYDGHLAVWLAALNSDEVIVTVQRDPDNAHDSNAIRVLVNDEQAGFIPARIAVALAPIIDGGGTVLVSNYEIKTKTDSKSSGKTKVSVQIFLTVADNNGEIADAIKKESPKKAVPSNTYRATDDVLDAIDGPSVNLFSRLKGSEIS